jgi:hypothetical protein
MLSDGDRQALRDRFVEVDYTVSGVVTAVGEAEHAALARNSTVPAAASLRDRADPLATLTRLWLLQRPVERRSLNAALPGLVPALSEAGIITAAGADHIRAGIDVRPYAADDTDLWIVSDLTPGLDTLVTPTRPDFVLGVSAASTTLAQLTIRRRVRSALDLGTGCGVQSLHLANHCGRIVATDLNPRALELARLTLALNGVEAELRHGSLYEPVAGGRFDLVVSNPPYVMAPPRPEGERLTYREGDREGDQLVEHLVRHAGDVLAEDGVLQLLANWAHVEGQDWADRLRGWVDGTGCDAHLVQREVLDPYEYVELWLADAGLAGRPGYRSRQQDWLRYLDRLGITAVGMGWIVLHRTDRDRPEVRVEEWPYPVEQPIGPAFAAEQDGLCRVRDLTDADLLSRSWALAPDVVQETSGVPGAADPQHIVLRQQRGFRRAVAADTALAGILGACDGELPLGVVVDAVAGLLDADREALRAEVVPRARRLVVDGMLLPA